MVSNCIFNQDPLFNYPQEGDFRIKSSSPAIGKGNGSWNAVYPNDIIGNFRQFPPTIGAYEYIGTIGICDRAVSEARAYYFDGQVRFAEKIAGDYKIYDDRKK
jgi:hypothetical protein